MNFGLLASFGIGQLYTAIMALVTVPLLANILSVEDVAAFGVMQQIISFSMTFFTLGLDQAFVREYSYCNDQHQLFANSFWPGFIFLTIILILIQLIHQNPLSLIGVNEGGIVLLGGICLLIIFNYIYKYYFLLLRVNGLGREYSIAQFLQRTLFVATILLCYLLGERVNFFDVISINLVCLFVGFVYCIYSANSELRFKIVPEEVGKLLAYGLPLAFAGSLSWAQGFMGVYYLQINREYLDLAIYSVVISITSGVGILQGIFATVWAPYAYKKIKNKQFISVFNRILSNLPYIFLLIYAGFNFGRFLLDAVLPAKYHSVQNLLMYTIIVPMNYIASEIIGFGMFVKKKVKTYMVLTCLGMLVNYILIDFFFQEYGLHSIVFAGLISSLLVLIGQRQISRMYWVKLHDGPLWVTILIMPMLAFIIDFKITINIYQSGFLFVISALIFFLALRRGWVEF